MRTTTKRHVEALAHGMLGQMGGHILARCNSFGFHFLPIGLPEENLSSKVLQKQPKNDRVKSKTCKKNGSKSNVKGSEQGALQFLTDK